VGNLRRSVDPLPDPEEPIRTELFSVERLEQHAESLAAAQRVTADPRRGWRVLPRLVDNGRVLLASYRAIARAIREERAITAAAGWSASVDRRRQTQLRHWRVSRRGGCPRRSPCSSSSACASRIRTSYRRCAGSKSGSRLEARRPKRPCASSITGKAP